MAKFVREAIGVFDNQDKLDAAIQELEATHFPRRDISVLGSAEELQKRFGSDAVDPALLKDSPRAPRSVSVRPEEKTIGATALIGALGYFGGCIAAMIVNPAANIVLLGAIALGSLIGAGIGGAIITMVRKNLKESIQRQIKKGGILVWVRTPEPRKEKTAQHILNKNGAKHVYMHGASTVS